MSGVRGKSSNCGSSVTATLCKDNRRLLRRLRLSASPLSLTLGPPAVPAARAATYVLCWPGDLVTYCATPTMQPFQAARKLYTALLCFECQREHIKPCRLLWQTPLHDTKHAQATYVGTAQPVRMMQVRSTAFSDELPLLAGRLMLLLLLPVVGCTRSPVGCC